MKDKGYLSEIFVSFQGEGAHVGRRHLFVRLAGCNLRCVYCDTPDSLERTEGYTVWTESPPLQGRNPISAAELGRLIQGIVQKDPPIDAIAVTGGEPLVQADFVATVLGAKETNLPVLLETNGVLPTKLREVLPLVDIVSMDLKLPSNTGEPEFWDEHAQFLELARSRELYVKLVVDEVTTSDDIDRACRLIATHAAEAAVYLQPKVAADGHIGITAERLTEFYRSGHKRLKSLRVLPQTHKAMGLM